MKRQYQIFALEIAKGNNGTQAYKIAFPEVKTDGGAAASATRLLKREDIKNEVVKLRQELAKAGIEQASEEIKKEKKFRLLDYNTKRQILSDIAKGKGMRIGKNKYQYPTSTERMRAVEMDNEMTGEGFQPPAPPNPGNTFNGPVYNTVQRVTVFKTRKTTAAPQEFQNPQQ